MQQPLLVHGIADLRATVHDWRRSGLRCALVPTMGALHEGHLALIRLAARSCERVVVSVFVNPLQFGPREDIARYPRRLHADVGAAAQAGAHLVFAPAVEEMFPPGHATVVHVAGLSEVLCGRHRPGHFDGVATVVSKLLLQTLPDAAFFGEKDYQQLLIVRRLVRDLDIPVRIEGMATVREPDGLALSSRNAYLSAAERQIAPALAATLGDLARRLAGGGEVAGAVVEGRARLSAAGFTAIDYLEVCDAGTLQPLERVTGPARVLAAVWLGDTRLIDNVPVLPAS
jgi:pantoate--beta-alanine ligase